MNNISLFKVGFCDLIGNIKSLRQTNKGAYADKLCLFDDPEKN